MALLSGQIDVPTAGTAVQGPSSPSGKIFAIKAHPDNADTVWVGNDGADDITASNSFPLNAGEGVTIDVEELAKQFTTSPSLAVLWFDADSNGDDICWLKIK
jgi:hypothetical protein